MERLASFIRVSRFYVLDGNVKLITRAVLFSIDLGSSCSHVSDGKNFGRDE